MKPAILIVGHGSRDVEGTQEFFRLVELFADEIRSRCGMRISEFAQPVIQAGVDRCGARRHGGDYPARHAHGCRARQKRYPERSA